MANTLGPALQIDCARRDASGRVTHVGGRSADGRRWLAELPAVIAAAERNETRYFIALGAQHFGLRVQDGELVTMVEAGWSIRSLPACGP